MALQHTFTSPHGVTSNAAYSRISHFSGDKNMTQCSVETFFNQQAREKGLQPLVGSSHTFKTPTDDDIMDATYAYLKTLPEFADAKDV